MNEDPADPAESFSIDELEAGLRRTGFVPRDLRRRMMRDARGMQRAMQADGYEARRVRFRLRECPDCGEIEMVCGYVGPLH